MGKKMGIGAVTMLFFLQGVPAISLRQRLVQTVLRIKIRRRPINPASQTPLRI
ncbi:hypothetical protein PP175_14010 [Aneurinibacillus sp. Ricciae_BoGa-3]|uniref:hypothetical protein n=1 Tax=Aneurinibacillus sp. Ricciae_BoGa-3 TaxID=3022697 RepID=UPI0023413730|nr:hypothetical protein [Aneurinibacillus sp. Ricciae_BoGa-3]WCK52553.1 hypothetical protein PP175_14010 [Aneurinibacillus sp. Ricciae_BoGa-3]